MTFLLDLIFGYIKEALDPEFTVNFRLNISFDKAASSNQVVLLFGNAQGIIRINSSRQIYSDVRG